MKMAKTALFLAALALVALATLAAGDDPQRIASAQEAPHVDIGGRLVSPFTAAPAEKNGAAPQAVTTGAFTYQGQLMRNGRPYTGTCTMTFSLYPGAMALDPMGVLTQSVPVSNGLFSADLDFDVFPNPKPFTGEERYLGIRVSCDGVTETLSPRQRITAVPYALGVRPGAVVSDGNAELKLLKCAGTACSGISVNRAADYGVRVDDSTPAAFYAKQTGTGLGLFSHSRSGVSVKSMSYSNDLFQGWEEVTVGGDQQLRFRVTYSGYVYADGTYSSPAADFAEMLPATAGLEAGDVLVVGPDGRLARSTSPNDTRVAGVFATQPAFLGGLPEEEMTQAAFAESAAREPAAATGSAGEASPKEVTRDPLARLYREQSLAPLSITGIVPVKASAENGPIMPGDLLTTASLPGYAMKATPVDVGGISLVRPGTIVGKALEGLDAETGVIRVLVALQ